MIWGETKEQHEERKKREWEDKLRRAALPRLVFAWRPVVLCDGRTVWLEHVWRHYEFTLEGDWRAIYRPASHRRIES